MKIQKIIGLTATMVVLTQSVALASSKPTVTNNVKSVETKQITTAQSESGGIVWTNFGNVELELTRADDSIYKRYELTFSNVNFNTEDTTNYYIFIANSNTKPELGTTVEELQQNATFVINGAAEKVVPDSIMSKYIENNGDIHVWIVESRYNNSEYENKEVLSAKKVYKPLLGDLGTRINTEFNLENTYIRLLEPYDSERKIKASVNVGKVTNNDVLLAIKNEEEGCLEDLMQYAGTATSMYSNGELYVGTNKSVVNDMELEEGSYYYAITELENANDEYRDVVDVSLYQAVHTEESLYHGGKIEGIALTNYMNEQFVWNLQEPDENPDQNPDDDPNKDPDDDPNENPGSEDEPGTSPEKQPDKEGEKPKDDTTATSPIPQTGENAVIIGLVLIIVTIAVIYFVKLIKYRDIK